MKTKPQSAPTRGLDLPSKIIDTLVSFLQTQTTQRGFERVVYGLSGGVDSAVVAFLCHKAFKDNAHALLMPSLSTPKSALKDALELCKSFHISYSVRPIAPHHALFKDTHKEASLTRQGNFCARLRMAALYDHALEHRALVVGTSNKSERLLGYGTIFGDLACAINPIGNLYKTQIYALARLLQIPSNILDKPPSADFYTGQSDEAELGFSYAEIDPLLFAIEQNPHLDTNALIALGFAPALVTSVQERVAKNAFKLEMPTICVV
ncbi:NH(3)-dependent NAD(+) synthetase NadE [Helicobacter ailurogastricus]|nr:NH(3)-dependent NAD(+) synthetase NadE [Helicobacter ailurogastricus]GLH59267.1 NH(3)-dependent NAD(+) synthetase NadE [Helicobacter ailurogastricus]